jgi:phosphate transport system ATP-binding protein
MNDLVPSCITKGDIFFDGMEIYEKDFDVYALRKRVGMVFQKPNLFRCRSMIIYLMVQGFMEKKIKRSSIKLSSTR